MTRGEVEIRDKKETYIFPSRLHDGPQESSRKSTDSGVEGCWGVRDWISPTKKLFVGHFCRAVSKCGGRDWMWRLTESVDSAAFWASGWWKGQILDFLL